MSEKLITTDPPNPGVDEFEEYLATDELFVDFFNHFLELPSFPEPHRFNRLTGGFEVLTPDKNQLAEKIKALSRAKRPKSSIYKNAIANPPMRLPHYEIEDEEDDDDIKTIFSVKCLDKEQGIEWIKENRLPQFFRSDLFIEYRLAKLLSQIETDKNGMKLTINPSYQPWNKLKPESKPEVEVDETAELMKRLKVSVGSMSIKQTKVWYTLAKQLEDSLTTSTTSSRPTSSISERLSTYAKSESSIKQMPSAVLYEPEEKREQEEPNKFTSRASVTFSSSLQDAEETKQDKIARIIPYHFKSSMQMSRVVKIEPQEYEDDSDQGMGSECDDIKEEQSKSSTSSEIFTSESDKLVLEETDETIAKHIVSNVIEEVFEATDSSYISEKINKLKRRDQREDVDVQFQSATSSPRKSEDLKTGSSGRKSFIFREVEELLLEDEADSVFSDETEDFELILSSRMQDFASIKEFYKFRSFLQNTVGEKLMQLWLDIDRTRFSIKQQKLSSFVQRMRENYLKVGSIKRLPNEILNKHKLVHGTQWKVDHLQSVQKDIVEPLLLYWAPRFLMQQMNEISKKSFIAKDIPLRSSVVRPISSQSYPSPKTITILPLRPKSCLPRIKQGQRPSNKLGHVVSEYHQFSEPEVYLRPYENTKLPDSPTSIPNYLKPKVAALTEGLSQKSFIKRPATAGPLTRQTIERFERRKSAAAKTRSLLLNRSLPVKPSPPSSVTSDTSVRGSPAMESMLQALYHDTRAGWFFTQFCESSKNSLWSNSIHFWFDVQEYHYLFYREIIDQFMIDKKSRMIYSTYIVNGSPADVGASVYVRKQISKVLDPPFDELFDAAEEYVLKLLIVPWNKMLGLDKQSYSKVELIEQERRLNVAAKYMDCLQKKGILKANEADVNVQCRCLNKKKPTILTEYEAEKNHEDDLWKNVPEEFQSFTFDNLIRNRIELEYFRKFLEQNYVKTDLMCWLDIETFKRLPHQADQKRDETAKEIREKYLNRKYFFGPNSPATKEEQNEAVKAGGGWGKTLKERPPTQLIVEAQKYVKRRIDNRWLPLFLATKEFQGRQRSASQMSDVAEDVILQKKKKRGEPWKLLDSRWQSSSRELMEFRQALLNPVTAGQFRRYASIRGEFLENDILFWLEVQRYKDFCHMHNEPSMIESKITSIINCFVHSHIPPSLQIDIPNEMAEKLMEKRRELGPYVFREAQLTVFRVLYPHWNSFCEFRKTLSDEKLTSTLERQRRKKVERMRKQLKEQEKEEIRREEMRAAKEAEAFDLPDVASVKGSDVGESLFSAPRSQVSWSYGKYVEGLDRQRMLLLMENEVKGRVPLEALRNPDYDVASHDSDDISDSDDCKSNESGSTTSKRIKKKKKEKIISSTVKTIPSSFNENVQNGSTNKTNLKDSTAGKKSLQPDEIKHDKASPAVVID